ncbi:hypothetical protein JCM10908_000111 [Rhodotorula pacifica]|uniref:uncharacterized protein n=1 Tax=Rhodotorula pacifica TaxID=1495444 RepID=UPI00317F3803
MEVRREPQLFTLDPTREPALCQAVIRATQEYLERPPLRPIDFLSDLVTTEDLDRQSQAEQTRVNRREDTHQAHLEVRIANRVLRLIQRFAGAQKRPSLAHAWADWVARSKEVNLLNARLYLAALHELLKDLTVEAGPASDLEDGYAAILFSRTPPIMFSRMHGTVPEQGVEAPSILCRQSLDQPLLRFHMRFTHLLDSPRIVLPPSASRCIPWSSEHKLETRTIEAIVRRIRHDADLTARAFEFLTYDEQGALVRGNRKGLAWLTAVPVREWYTGIDDTAKDTFAFMLECLGRFVQDVAYRSGPFIARAYLLAWSPKAIQDWMSKHANTATPFPGSSAYPHHQQFLRAHPEFHDFLDLHSFLALRGTEAHQLGLRGRVRYSKAARHW